MTEPDPTLERLEDQINWYDRKSNHCQLVYKWLKIIEIVAAALVPLSAGLHLPAPLTGSLGVSSRCWKDFFNSISITTTGLPTGPPAKR